LKTAVFFQLIYIQYVESVTARSTHCSSIFQLQWLL